MPGCVSVDGVGEPLCVQYLCKGHGCGLRLWFKPVLMILVLVSFGIVPLWKYTVHTTCNRTMYIHWLRSEH